MGQVGLKVSLSRIQPVSGSKRAWSERRRGRSRQAGARDEHRPVAADVLISSGGEPRRKRGVGAASSSTMAQFLGASSSKKRRAGEEGEVSEAAAMTAQEEDRISALPEDLRLRILALLPLKTAIRTGALSSPWRALWARRWPAPPSLDLLLPLDDPDQLLESLERRGRRRLDRFALTVHWFPYPHRFLGDKDVHRCLDYAAACGVEDLCLMRFCATNLKYVS